MVYNCILLTCLLNWRGDTYRCWIILKSCHCLDHVKHPPTAPTPIIPHLNNIIMSPNNNLELPVNDPLAYPPRSSCPHLLPAQLHGGSDDGGMIRAALLKNIYFQHGHLDTPHVLLFDSNIDYCCHNNHWHSHGQHHHHLSLCLHINTLWSHVVIKGLETPIDDLRRDRLAH